MLLSAAAALLPAPQPRARATLGSAAPPALAAPRHAAARHPSTGRRLPGGLLAVRASGDGEGIGADGLKGLLEDAASSLGHCRFICANSEVGGILESVCDFGAAPLRYSAPSGRGTFATLGPPGGTFEMHVNLDKIEGVAFANPERPDGSGGTKQLYVMRLLGAEGKVAMSVLLHDPAEMGAAEGAGHGSVEGWKALREKYGDTVKV